MQNVLDLKKQVSEEPAPVATPVAQPEPELEPEPVSEIEPLDPAVLAERMFGAVELPAAASWTAHHALGREARQKHLYLSLGLVLVGVLVSLAQSSVVPFLVLLAGAVALELREHLGKPVSVEVDSRGIAIDGRLHDHASFASFHIHRMPDETLELSLKSSRRLLPDLRLPLGEQDPHELHAVLTQHIPEEEHLIPLVEYYLRKPKR